MNTIASTAGMRDEDAVSLSVAPRSGGILGALLLAAIYAGLWLHLTPYAGLGHDAQAYAVEALANLRPDIYAQDLFLAVRSQEEFTIFPKVYAPLIDAFGLEDAAAWTVALCQLFWFAAAFLLLRQLAGTTMALFSVGLLITVSGTYGGFRVFHFAENFLTARLPAEALALFGFWLFLKQRWWLATVLLLLAIAVHPLMAFPVAILAACVWIAERWSSRAVIGTLVAGSLVALGGAWVLGGATPFMEGRWLVLTQMRSAFLFVDFWRLNDWNDTLLSLVTLVLTAAAFDRRRVRLIVACTAGIALAGLALATVTNFWLHLEVLIQGQPWRWLWVARFFAIAFLPITVFALWRDSVAGRSVALLLIAGWLFVAPITSGTPTLLMFGSMLSVIALIVWMARKTLSPSLLRITDWGSRLVLGVVVVSSIATMALAWTVMGSGEGPPPEFSRQVTNALALLTPALLLAIVACLITRVAWSPMRGAAVSLVAALLVGTGAVSAMPGWTERPFSGRNYEAFADWRALIREDQEVLWYDNLRETWFLLERRSYLTRSQSGGVVFSEALADEVVRRALVLEPYIDRNFWISITPGDEVRPYPLTSDILAEICLDPELGFIVSGDQIGSEISSLEWPEPGTQIHLYRCADFREGD